MYIHVSFENLYGVLVSRADLTVVNTLRNRVQIMAMPIFFSFHGGFGLEAR